jgi:hypothetical protein
MTQRISKSRFTTIGPGEVWKLYNNMYGIFRGGGGKQSPKLIRADGPRRSDLLIVVDPATQLEMVHPCSTMGISFADSITVLAKKKVEGWVWVLPSGSCLPEGLIFNVREIDHPLLNVSKIMSVLDLVARLSNLADLLEPCQIKIDRSGAIVEESPGLLAKASQRW